MDLGGGQDCSGRISRGLQVRGGILGWGTGEEVSSDTAGKYTGREDSS